MKKTIKVFGNLTRAANAAKAPLGIIALAVIIIFSMAACGDDDDPDNPNSDNNENLSGTYSRTADFEDLDITTSFTFTSNNNYTFKLEGFDDPEIDTTFNSTYTLNGNTITFVFPINDDVVSTCIARLSANRNSFEIKEEDQEPLEDPEDEEDFLFGTYTKQ